jgi:hypothetical protein
MLKGVGHHLGDGDEEVPDTVAGEPAVRDRQGHRVAPAVLLGSIVTGKVGSPTGVQLGSGICWSRTAGSVKLGLGWRRLAAQTAWWVR